MGKNQFYLWFTKKYFADHWLSVCYFAFCVFASLKLKSLSIYVIYIRNSLNYRIRNDLMNDTLELLIIEISKPRSKPFLVGT